LAVTPLQVLAAYSAVANGGLLLEPRLVLQVGGKTEAGPVVVRRVASPESIAKMRSMLELVIAAGTGKSAAVSGYRVAGKTGTAQKVDPATGKYSGSDYIASFAGYAPAEEPGFTILVILDSPQVGYYAAEVAAPIFSRVAREVLALRGVKPEETLPLQAAKPAPAAPGGPKGPAGLTPRTAGSGKVPAALGGPKGPAGLTPRTAGSGKVPAALGVRPAAPLAKPSLPRPIRGRAAIPGAQGEAQDAI